MHNIYLVLFLSITSSILCSTLTFFLLKKYLLNQPIHKTQKLSSISNVLQLPNNANDWEKFDELIDYIFYRFNELKTEEEVFQEELKNKSQENNLVFKNEEYEILREIEPTKEFDTENIALQNDCIKLIEAKLNIRFPNKEKKTCYSNEGNNKGLVYLRSKLETRPNYRKYYYTLHQPRIDFLNRFQVKYTVFLCGTIENLILMEFNDLKQILSNLSSRINNNLICYDIRIIEINNKFYIRTGKRDKIEVTKYLVRPD